MDNKKKYYYRVYGLSIASDLCLSELITDEGTAVDITISYGTVPGNIEAPAWASSVVKLSEKKLLLHIEDVADYYVEGGQTIIVQPAAVSDEACIKLYLLGTCLGTAMLQRGILPVHGSSVILNGLCIIFTGVSGAGKSSICAALRKMGYQFLSDDVSAVTLDQDGLPWVQPGFPLQRLCEDSLAFIGKDTGNLKLVSSETSKYLIPDESGFERSAALLYAICELVPAQCSQVKLTQLFGTDKLKLLINNIYRTEFLGSIGLKPDYFKQCITVAGRTKFYRMERPRGVFTLEEQIAMLLQELRKPHMGTGSNAAMCGRYH